MAEKFTKHDQAKPMLQLWPPSRVLTHGAKKYSPDNWRQVDDTSRYMSAALRHLFAYMKGEKYDADSGEPHLAHAVCCIAFMLDLDEEKADVEDFGNVKAAEDFVQKMMDGTITKHDTPLTHYVSKSEEPAEKWADDLLPCGPWEKIASRWQRRESPKAGLISVEVLSDFSWHVWVRLIEWEEHPPEESIEAAKAAADKRLRGD